MQLRLLPQFLDSRFWKEGMNCVSLNKTYLVFGLLAFLSGGILLSTPFAAIAASTSPAIEISQATQTAALPQSLANRLKQDLSQRVGIPPSKLRIIETAPKTWINGCLGLAKPDEMCSQAMVEGWRVVLTDGQRQWVYRTDRPGRTLRLEPPGNPPR